MGLTKLLVSCLLLAASLAAAQGAPKKKPPPPKPTASAAKLAALRKALKGLNVTSYFSTMDTTLFTSILAGGLNNKTRTFTFLVPVNKAWDAAEDKTISKLDRRKQQQVVAYHVLDGAYPFAKLKAAKKGALFTTTDYGLNITKATGANAAKVTLARLGPKADSTTITRSNAYRAPQIIAHLVDSVMFPYKWK